jgi:hypothetical protein
MSRLRMLIAGVAIGLASGGWAQSSGTSFPASAADAIKLKIWLDAQTIPAPPYLTFYGIDGEVLPSDVPLHDIQASAGVTAAQNFKYAEVRDRVMVLDPATRKVVYLTS